MARGGSREGTPGVAYANRADLNQPKPLAPTAATGQTYGDAGQQIAAQRAIPMAPPPPIGAGAPPATPPVHPDATAVAPDPSSMPAWDRPSERPGEHVMSGAPLGPGPGAEALGLNSSDTLAGTLSRIAATPGVPPEVAQLAAYVNSGRR